MADGDTLGHLCLSHPLIKSTQSVTPLWFAHHYL